MKFYNNISSISIAEPRVLAPRRKRIGQLHPLFQFSNNVSSIQQSSKCKQSIQAKQQPPNNGHHWIGAMRAATAAGRSKIHSQAHTHTRTHARMHAHALRTKGNQRHISGSPHLKGGRTCPQFYNDALIYMCLSVCELCVCVLCVCGSL